MRKLLSALFLVLSVVSFSNCSLFTGINKDPMAAAVVNAISESKLDNKVYCDNSGYRSGLFIRFQAYRMEHQQKLL